MGIKEASLAAYVVFLWLVIIWLLVSTPTLGVLAGVILCVALVYIAYSNMEVEQHGVES